MAAYLSDRRRDLLGGSEVRHPSSGEELTQSGGGRFNCIRSAKEVVSWRHVHGLDEIGTVTLFVWKDQGFGLFCASYCHLS